MSTQQTVLTWRISLRRSMPQTVLLWPVNSISAETGTLDQKLNEIIGKQVVAMREAAMEQNENLKEAIANGDLSIGDLEMDIRKD